MAFGEKLSFRQEDLRQEGHSIEFRICAEDPEKFLPQAGRMTGVNFPSGIGVRVDSHLYRGYDIPVFYDSMIAKISVWGRDRQEAIARGKAALQDTVLNGVKTNIPVHLQILDNPKFISGNYTTKLIGEDFNYKEAVPEREELKMALISAAVAAYNREFRGGNVDKTSLSESRWKQVARQEGLY